MRPSHHPRPSEAEAIEATAAAWLAQRDDGLTPEQTAEFFQWRGADVRHEAAVARLEATWTALQQLREFRPEAARHPDRDLLRAPIGRRRAVPFPALAATVTLAASLVLAAVWWFSPAQRRAENAAQTYATTLDGYERVALADSSIVELNSASEINVNFSPAERRVRLVRGEAHFTVAKNPARPFLVEAGSVAVRAVGTAFNVRLGAKQIEVLVTEGRVAVATPEDGGRRTEDGGQTPDARGQRSEVGGQRSGSRLETDGRADRRVFAELGANERVVVSVAPASAVAGSLAPPVIEKVAPEVVREALAWQGPRLMFVDTPLADAIAQFNRRNPVQLELADVELGALPIGGSFRAENVDAFVRLLASGGDISVERSSPNRIVLRRPEPARRPD
jgi:transmembrane sensor